MQPRAPRYRFGSLNFIYDTGESFWAAPVLDVSESGVFLETAHQLDVGTQVTLVPDVADDEKLPFELTAQVVRVNEFDTEENFKRPPGIAFRLLNLTAAQSAELRTFLHERGVLVR
ncbi:MAG: PilZ domain-containing protein [Myxococcota bacterium]